MKIGLDATSVADRNLIAFFTFFDFLSVKNMFWEKKTKIFGVKLISVDRFFLGWNFLNKTSNLNFTYLYGKYIQFSSTNFTVEQIWLNFCSTFLYFEYNCRNLKFWVIRVPSIIIPTQDGEMKVLFNKCDRRINLTTLLFSSLGAKNKIKCSKFKNYEILSILSYKIWSLMVPYV
jgi:hypothetical protein